MRTELTIAHITRQRFPNRLVGSRQVIKTVSALAGEGLDLLLVYPRKWKFVPEGSRFVRLPPPERAGSSVAGRRRAPGNLENRSVVHWWIRDMIHSRFTRTEMVRLRG